MPTMFYPRIMKFHQSHQTRASKWYGANCISGILLLLLYFASSSTMMIVDAYEPTWESLDTRPLPEWYSNAKIGIFIHWGIFSVPAFQNEWFWYKWHTQNLQDYKAFVEATENTRRFNYPDYAHRFDATLYSPDVWADLFAQSGAQYVVLTSKHHEGYCMFDSRNITTTWNWNVMDIGPRRDLLGDLATSIRNPTVISPQTNQQLKFGVYHSLFEWYNPMFLDDQRSNFTTQNFVNTKTMPELYHLVNTYQPELIWSDGDAQGRSSDYWKSREFLAWLTTNSTVRDSVVFNDRWGPDAICKHGSFLTCVDRYLPNATSDHYFENAFTLDQHSWGWNRAANFSDFLTTKEVIVTIVHTISRNGNANINIGPNADGTISPIFVDRLLGMGKWLSVNGEGVYNTRPWKVCNQDQDGTVVYTRNDHVLYAHVTKWPTKNRLVLSCPERTDSTSAYMLGLKKNDDDGGDGEDSLNVQVLHNNNKSTTTKAGEKSIGMEIIFPQLTPDLVPCDHVWVIAIRNIGNLDAEAVQPKEMVSQQ